VHQGKTKKSVRTVISKPPAVDAIKQLKEVYLEYSDILNKEKVDRNIIFPFNQSQSNLTLLKSADLYEDKEMKKKRDVYTYRHTYISWSVLKGSALFNIAKNCGTSVAMIEKHYANNLTSVHFQNVLSTLKI
jgi:integrase